jgi:hypothetical protein
MAKTLCNRLMHSVQSVVFALIIKTAIVKTLHDTEVMMGDKQNSRLISALSHMLFTTVWQDALVT